MSRGALVALRRAFSSQPPPQRPPRDLTAWPPLATHLVELLMPLSWLAEPAAAMQVHAPQPPASQPRAAQAAASSTPSASTDGSSGCQAAPLQRPKSAKRRAAESLLERRFSSNDLVGAAAAAAAAAGLVGDAATPAKRPRVQERPPVRVAACSDCAAAAACDGCAQAAADWCAQDVALPPMDWAAVLQSVRHESDVAWDRAEGCYRLPGGQSGMLLVAGPPPAAQTCIAAKLPALQQPQGTSCRHRQTLPAHLALPLLPPPLPPQAASACTSCRQRRRCLKRWPRCAPACRTAVLPLTSSGSQRVGRAAAPAAWR